MGRRRGPKFSFPIPGFNKSSSKADKNFDEPARIPSVPSIAPVSSASDRTFRYDETSSISSKAQRLLGTAPPPFRAMLGQSAVPPSPGYTNVAASDNGLDCDDGRSAVAVDDGAFQSSKWPASNRASSSIMPPNIPLYDDETRASNYSSVSRRLNAASSNATLREHYDAKNSPLSISQQTSDSAVRDMALRKGKPQINTYDRDHVPTPLAYEIATKDHRRSKPPRLDLSKLFPKPRGPGDGFEGTLLSPNKLVNSPSAMSTYSDHFPRPMNREPIPAPNGHAKLTRSQQQQAPSVQPVKTTSPVRSYRRDSYDSAKVNVRRPPRGIQHWFEALSEDSDELDEEERTPMQASMPINHSRPYSGANRTSYGPPLPETTIPKRRSSRGAQGATEARSYSQFHASSSAIHRLKSPPSLFSIQSQSSLGTTRTKESAFSRSNLQDSSVLSFSSSEDEEDNNQTSGRKVSVRSSITTEDSGDIIIGRAQAFEVRPHDHLRRPSVGKSSLMSTSTNAATIEVMYTPDQPFGPTPRFPTSARRKSHTKQPSVIHEVEVARPKTSRRRSVSPSARSNRTSKSEPQLRDEARKFMAVTAEEEALLEALRKKRAAMALSDSPGSEMATKREEALQRTPPDLHKTKNHRTSAFLSAASPSSSPVRIVETKKKTNRKSTAPEPLPLLPPRGRAIVTRDANGGTTIRRDSSSCDPNSERQTPVSARATTKPILSPPEFSPVDLFPSSTPTASVASPTTTDHPSSLPSPVTPRMRHGEDDIDFKVASSEPSWNGDTEDVAVPETGVIDPPAGSIKSEDAQSNHQRRRTASSGADIAVAIPMPSKHQSTGPRSLTPLTEASSRSTSAMDTQPDPPKKSLQRNPSLSIKTTGLTKSRHTSISSNHTMSPNRYTTERRSSRQISRAGSLASIASIKRDSIAVGTASTRCSVSEDVLAAWGSLGGMRDYATARW